jgi:hypothetical protein
MEEIDRRSFYEERYETIAGYLFETGNRVSVTDPGENRICRFCSRDSTHATFNSESHAIPEFLGNRTVFCGNECDECNARFGRDYEDHLAKWSHLVRSTMKIRGKKKYPIFKTDSFRIEPEKDNLHIRYLDPDTPRIDPGDVPFDHELFGDSSSQPYIPKRAAMSLTKIAASICPPPYIHEFKRAIEWLNAPDIATISGSLVGYAFTPGPVPSAASHAILLRRKTDDHVPYMWLILQCRNFRLQSFVPFCESDTSWMRTNEAVSIPFYAFPSIFGEQWTWGLTQFGTLDWSSSEPQCDEAKVSFRFLSLKSTDEEPSGH